MSTISKALVGTVAAGAMAMVPAVPAAARDYHDRDRGISAGDVIAGAVILGGIAAVASSIGNNNRRDHRYYRDGRYGYYNGNPRVAVEQCVSAVRQDARRNGYRYTRVTEIRDVDDTSYGWKIKGDLVVEGSRRGYYDRGGYYSRDRHYNNGYYNSRYDRRADDGRFTCWIDRGRVTRVDYHGIRGL